MQVSLTATGGLERRLEVAIPAAQVDGEVAQRLEQDFAHRAPQGLSPWQGAARGDPPAVRRAGARRGHQRPHARVVLRSRRAREAQSRRWPAHRAHRDEPGRGSQVRRRVRSAARSEAQAAVSELAIERPVASVGDTGSRRHDRHAAQAAPGVQRSVARGGRQRSRHRGLHRQDRRRRVRRWQRRGRAHRHRRGPGHEGIRRCAAGRARRRHARVQRDLRAPTTPTRSSPARPPRST